MLLTSSVIEIGLIEGIAPQANVFLTLDNMSNRAVVVIVCFDC
jgi:hypothetical protein